MYPWIAPISPPDTASPVSCGEVLQHLQLLLLQPWCAQECFSLFFLTPLFIYIWPFLPLIKYIFPEVPPAELKGSAMSSGGAVWQDWLGLAMSPHPGPCSKTSALQGLPACCCTGVSVVWCAVLAGDQYCGGRLEKPSGSFQTPNWPERDYPAGVTCSWHIVAPKNQVRRCHHPASTAQLPLLTRTNTS